MRTKTGSIKKKPPHPGRPTADPAIEHIHFRVSSARKAAYLRAAEPAKLSEWMFEHLDREAGYTPPS
jgi:hypothetical protein